MVAIDYKAFFMLIARLILAGVLVMAALPKIQDPGAFANSVAAFRVIDLGLSSWVALVLPWLELVLGLGILMPFIRQTSCALIGLLLLIFIGLHLSAWVRGLDLRCGCFGADADAAGSDYRWLILRNLLLLGMAMLLLTHNRPNKQ